MSLGAVALFLFSFFWIGLDEAARRKAAAKAAKSRTVDRGQLVSALVDFGDGPDFIDAYYQNPAGSEGHWVLTAAGAVVLATTVNTTGIQGGRDA